MVERIECTNFFIGFASPSQHPVSDFDAMRAYPSKHAHERLWEQLVQHRNPILAGQRDEGTGGGQLLETKIEATCPKNY